MPIIYLNGEYLPQEDAKISVMDRGFLFGDGVYEVVPVYDGYTLGLEEHIDRLDKSLASIHMQATLSLDGWKKVLNELLERNDKKTGEHSIYIQVTRGADETRNHAIPSAYQPTVLAFCTPSKSQPRHTLEKGFSAITLDDTRRRDCGIKAITLLPTILLYEEVKKVGALEAILIRNGQALEGTSSNLFVVINDQLLTPPLNNQILGGVTRELIIKLAKENDIHCLEKSISEPMLHDASEIWMTGSSKEIVPITKLNDKPVGTGKVGPFWQRMIDYYQEHKLSIRK